MGITVQVALLLGLAYWVVQKEAIQYCEPGTPTIDGRQLSPAELAVWRQEGFGPAPGWQLYDVPIEVFTPHLWLAILLLAAAYVCLIVYAVWKKRCVAAFWWLLPVTLTTITFFVLA